MKLRYMYGIVISSALIFLCGLFLIVPQAKAYYYGCGAGPCNGSYPCNAPYECNGGVCGIYFDACSGATCVDNLVFDSSACNTGNACTPAGSTATAAWDAACSASCGSGTKTCRIGVNNGCPIACTGPAGAINSTTPCCVSQIPQTAPSAVTCSQVGISRTALVNWAFNDTGSLCGQAWGFNCSGNTNTFQLRFSGGKTTENTLSGADRSLTTGIFPNWGAYTVQVCAENGFGENCSPAATCTLNAPPCSASGQDVTNATPNDACIATDPNLSASWGNNANQIQFLVHDNTSTTLNPAAPYNNPPYPATSTWLASSPASYTPALSTGTYYWNVHTQSTASPVDCITPAVLPTGMQLNIDKTPPGVPVMITPTWAPDPACLGKYKVTYNWGATTDADCAGMNALPYQANISNNLGYASSPPPNALHNSGWTANTFYETPVSYAGGTTLYARVHARDSLNTTSNWSTSESVAYTVPSPSPFPTILIQGDYQEDLGYNTNVCVGGMNIDPANLTMNLNVGPDATSSCTLSATSYKCFVTINNQTSLCSLPLQTVSVDASTSYGGYEAVEWRTGNACGGAPFTSISVNGSINNPNPTPIQLYFKYGAQTWFKTSSISFNNKAQRNNIIPNNTVQFDTDDNVSPPNNKYMIVGNGGAVLEGMGDAINLGGNATLGYSANNWFNASYPTAPSFTPSKFADYMKSRKQYKTITSTVGLSDGVYYYSNAVTPLNLSSSDDFKNKKIVIVADNSTVNIATDIVLANGSLAIVANNITIDGAVGEVDAILIGNTVSVGSTTNYLKILGNLIQLNDNPAFINTRISADGRKPSLFIKLNESAYLNLLQYLSISVYDWRQVQ